MSSNMAATPVRLHNREYVILPRDEYDRLVGMKPGTGDAVAFAASNIARGLRAAREHAGLSQAQLAKKIKKSQSAVAKAEGGDFLPNEAYVNAVMKACGLPMDWKPGQGK